MPREPIGKPKVLTIPGLEGSGVNHWQSAWERERSDCRRVELGDWSDPHRDTWLRRLDQAVAAEGDGVVLVAHSLGCLAVCWWASRAGKAAVDKVTGALLVAPPDVDREEVDPRLARFAPTPFAPLPFAAMLVASSNDPYATLRRSREMAALWDAQFVDLGEVGHINAGSALGAWPGGQHLLSLLIRQGAQRRARRPIGLPAQYANGEADEPGVARFDHLAASRGSAPPTATGRKALIG